MRNVYKEAYEAYDRIVAALAKIIDNAVKNKMTGDESINVQNALVSFDIIIQYSMLQIAIADNNLAKEEINFIKSVTKYSSYCDFLKVHNIDLTWDQMVNTKISELDDILKVSYKDVLNMSKTFFTTFALYDAATPEVDLTVKLIEDINRILIATICADGRKSDDEIPNDNLMIYVVIKCIGQLKAKLEKKLSK